MSDISENMPVSRTLRWVEFLTLFIATPVLIAVALPPDMMFPALFAATAIGVALLGLTRGFRWSSLWVGISRIRWGFVLLTAGLTALVGLAVLWAFRPGAIFMLLGQGAPVTSNGVPIIVIIALFYPIVSALPQELVFRPLFFRRYGSILPSETGAIVLNAATFSLAHLMYWSWIVALMTFVGGLLFAHSYERRGSFPEAVVLHSVTGVVLFAVGMGAYFYSGNVRRPF
ncbi:CPBP family glutamic-type intramembrane protease [Litoreibacter roseus]|uniref:CAAX prenyl protease 2/Lysostaphin resistance protein A-like domain-containing protein n=1 Tax=Litoreibacter roseus TaxID=2601869 RepID=A0A6N6JAY1_9RHOB|nr:CPBP family glutamic-type intramembrane protease [Litoreibacter roseus]GFE63335.1 hypothetical protein KIN_04090 [Litoreibacter roseus]